MKSIVDYIKECLIVEGGNAIQSATEIPAVIAPKIFDEIEKTIHAKYKDLDIAALGSIGKKPDDSTTGDIDIAVRIDNKEDLNKMVDDCFSGCEINYKTMNTITSIGYQYNIDGYKGVAQIDFMMVKNMDWAKAYFHSPNLKLGESKYKGAVRTTFLNDIISCIPVADVKDEYFEDGKTVKRHWKHTFNTEGIFIQLLDWCGKNGKVLKNPNKLKEFEKFVTNDPLNMVRFIFGDLGTMDDINSAESLWSAIHSQKFQWGDEVLAKIEEKIITDPTVADKIDKKDFPCKFYKGE